MKNFSILIAKICIALIASLSFVSVAYGLYQQSQFYPMLHQQIGFNACVQQIQAEQAQQQSNADQNVQ